MRIILVLMLSGLVGQTLQQRAEAEEMLCFISAFAGGQRGAIHAFHLDPASGKLTPTVRTADVENPFFLALAPNQKTLYTIHAANGFGGKHDEQVAAYRIDDRRGKLTLLNRQSTRGTASCYLDTDAAGKALLVANYTSGSVGSLPLDAEGRLGSMATFMQHAGSSVDPARQQEPHAHCFVISPDNRFAFAADLGLDKIMIYQLDSETARLTPARQPFARTLPGAGPRHLTFHPDGKHLYAINELHNSVTHYAYLPDSGVLLEQKTVSTLPPAFKGTSYCADLKVTPNGKFLYGTNRGHDSLAAYRIADDGSLTLQGIRSSLGKGPQNLAITPDGQWLLCANMPGNNVAVFKIESDGTLSPMGEPVEMPSPSCIRLAP